MIGSLKFTDILKLHQKEWITKIYRQYGTYHQRVDH